MLKDFVISSEENLLQFYAQSIEPFWQTAVEKASFTSQDGLEIAYACAIHPQAKGSVVISAGRIEAYIKYKEVVFELYQNGYSVFIHDHRGQGFSGRMTTNPHLGFVHDFADYVQDFEQFMQQVVMPHSSHQPMLLAHSMGCAIGFLYCLAHPQRFSRAVLCAPMFGIRPALPKWLSSLLLSSHFALSTLLGREYAYFVGQKDYVSHAFKGNNLTHSAVRYQIFRDEYVQNPQAQLGGVSTHWLRAALQAMNKIEQHAGDFPLPSLLLQAGSDQVVDNQRQCRVAEKMRRCQFMPIEHAHHELLMEQDQYRQPTMQAILRFLAGLD